MTKCCEFLSEMKRRKINQNFYWNFTVDIIRYLTITSILIARSTCTASSPPSFGVTLACSYRMSSIPWPVLGEIYECYIESDLFITHSKMPVTDASGTHKSWKNNDKVIGFYARSAVVHYFPNGLEKIFPNLRLIAIAMSNLREIRQQNLIPFDQLQYLCLFDNDIETIEKHLFAYNLMLEAIDLRENRIVRINVNVFDYLINLRILYLSDAFNGSCVSTDAGDRDAVVKLINEIKEDCNDRAIWRIVQSEKGAAKSIGVVNVTEKEIHGDVREEKNSQRSLEVVEDMNEIESGGAGRIWCVELMGFGILIGFLVM